MIVHASHEGLAFQTPSEFSIFHFVQKGDKEAKEIKRALSHDSSCFA